MFLRSYIRDGLYVHAMASWGVPCISRSSDQGRNIAHGRVGVHNNVTATLDRAPDTTGLDDWRTLEAED